MTTDRQLDKERELLCTRLVDAIHQDNLGAAQDILAGGFDLRRGRDQELPLWLLLACSKGSLAMVKLLVAAGAYPHQCDGTGGTALHYASGENVAYLLSLGLNIEKRNNEGLTPLMEHCKLLYRYSGPNESVRALLAAGADPNARCTKKAMTPAMYAVGSGGDRMAALQDLAAAGADFSLRDRQGASHVVHALRLAGKTRVLRPNVLVPILKHGGTFDPGSGQFELACLRAVKEDSIALWDQLAQHGLRAQDDQQGLLRRAIETNAAASCAWLLEAGWSLDDVATPARRLTMLKRATTCASVIHSHLARREAQLAIASVARPAAL